MADVHKAVFGEWERMTDKRFETHPTGIAGILLRLPQAHPFWVNYHLSLITLKPVEGLEDVVKHHPLMTHEFLLFALNPEKHPDPTNYESFYNLMPPNYSEQFMAETDGHAIQLLEAVAQGFIEGKLHPEPTDWGGARPLMRRFIAEKLPNEGNNAQIDKYK